MTELQSPLEFNFKVPEKDTIISYFGDSIEFVPGPYKLESLCSPVSTESILHVQPSPRMDVGDRIFNGKPDWITGVLILCFILLAWIRFNFNRRLKQVGLACFLPRYVNQLQREGNLFNEQITIGLSLIYLTSYALLATFSVQFYSYPDVIAFEQKWLFVFAMTMVLVVWLIKAGIHRLFAFVFDTLDTANNYLLNNLLFNLVNGIALLVLLPFIFYTDSVVAYHAALCVTALLLLYKTLRGLAIGLNINKFPLYYLFIYFIGIEVLPLLIIFKTFMVAEEFFQSMF